MNPTRGDKRFWASTRGRIILLLRRGSRTVNELAGELALTNNAVRTHLTSLERDGLVHSSGTRPGPRKPHVTYDLTPEAGRLFPRVYHALLDHLLGAMKERIPAAEVEAAVRGAGERLAAAYRPAESALTLRGRVEQAVAVLEMLGGLPEPEQSDGRHAIRSFDCPVAQVAAHHPEVCRLMETFLAALVGAPVRQHCQTRPVPRCYFEIGDTRP